MDEATEKGKQQCLLLLKTCLRRGPNDLDMAIFVKAHQCRLSIEDVGPSAVSAYVDRFGSQDKKLSFLPLLEAPRIHDGVATIAREG